jgi:asparagine synthase (glutamine-hydrolysing)
MCGINGFTKSDRELITRMNEVQHHRGPDSTGIFVDDQVTLGTNLLAIMETPEGFPVPFISEDQNFVLTYNGEIYNYRILRDELEAAGDSFRTFGDTEVLLKGLMRFGADFIGKLDGMFAFALYDKKNRKILLARDRMGMKPLYYVQKNDTLFFASEMKTLLESGITEPNLNHAALPVFFELGYIPGQTTFIEKITKVLPGEYLIFDLEQKHLQQSFFSTPSVPDPKEQYEPGRVRSLVSDAVFDHTMGLRPFGMYLSGGLDSSVVLYELIQRGISTPTTFTTRFDVADPKYNEDADTATILSKKLGTRHHELLVTETDFIDAIQKTIHTIEEPRYHPSLPAYYLMAQHASKSIVVMLTGDGGDELFLGYPKYIESAKMSSHYRRFPAWLVNMYYSWQKKRQGKIGSEFLALDEPLIRWWYLSKIISRRQQILMQFPLSPERTWEYLSSIKLPQVQHPQHDMENAIAEFDRLFWLAEDSLIMTDRIGMHFGMEGRFPFLDQRLVQYATSVPSSEKLKGPGTKRMLRHTYGDLLPREVAEKRKSGWTAPVSVWMGSKLGDMVREVISPDFYEGTRNLFHFKEIHDTYLRDRGIPYSSQLVKSIFPIFTFQLWAQQFKIKL